MAYERSLNSDRSYLQWRLTYPATTVFTRTRWRISSYARVREERRIIVSLVACVTKAQGNPSACRRSALYKIVIAGAQYLHQPKSSASSKSTMETGEDPSVGDGATSTAPDEDGSVTGSTIETVGTDGLKSVGSAAVAAPKAEGASGSLDSSVTSGLIETEETAVAPEASGGDGSGDGRGTGTALKKEDVSGGAEQASLAVAANTCATTAKPEPQPQAKYETPGQKQITADAGATLPASVTKETNDETPRPKQITADAGATLPASITKETKGDTPGPKQITTAAGAVLPASVVKEIQDRETDELLDLAKSKGDGDQLRTITRGGVTSRTKEDDDDNAGLVGREREGGGGLSPTPPRRTSNPITRGTPPRRGSRGGNLAIITQSPGNEPDLPRPMSPRSRPRDQPLVRAKHERQNGGKVDGGEGDSGSDYDDDNDERKDNRSKAATFSSRRWKASDEYVLDEDR